MITAICIMAAVLCGMASLDSLRERRTVEATLGIILAVTMVLAALG